MNPVDPLGKAANGTRRPGRRLRLKRPTAACRGLKLIKHNLYQRRKSGVKLSELLNYLNKTDLAPGSGAMQLSKIKQKMIFMT